MNRFNGIADVHKFLERIPRFQNSGANAARFALEPMEKAAARLGDPHKQFKSIHVAGTNGKGTTCYVLSEMYRQAGYKTGLYTSPHLMRYNERVKLNGKEISDDDLTRFFRIAGSKLQLSALTYFEISTLLAFWYFAQNKVDIAIIETGLGGRLDSTNIISPVLSIITSIGKDHTDILGNTVEAIAGEKAGIIKEQTPVLAGNLDENSMNVIKKHANEKNAVLHTTEKLNPVYEGSFKLTVVNEVIDLGTPFLEPVNKFNLALAWYAAKVLKKQFPVQKQQMIETIKHLAPYPARFERLSPIKDWYFSGSHNGQAFHYSTEVIRSLAQEKEPFIILSLLRDKVNEPAIEILKQYENIFFYEQNSDRSAVFGDIHDVLPKVKKLSDDQVLKTLEELRSELVIFTGSFYFYPTVKGWMGQIKT